MVFLGWVLRVINLKSKHNFFLKKKTLQFSLVFFIKLFQSYDLSIGLMGYFELYNSN
jgi:hypothetical protein